jgi:hypothetical protein
MKGNPNKYSFDLLNCFSKQMYNVWVTNMLNNLSMNKLNFNFELWVSGNFFVLKEVLMND